MNSLVSMLFFLFTFFSFNPLFSSASQSSYKDHCSSIIPETAPTTNLKFKYFPLSDQNTGYYRGGDSIINVDASRDKFSLDFPTRNTHATQNPYLFKIEGTISFKSNLNYGSYSRHGRYNRGYLTFKLDGFWSKSSGNVCMIGKSNGVSKKGDDSLNLDVVFKLNNVFNSSNITSLISGSLESLSSEKGHDDHFFEPISLMIFPKENYSYSLDSKEVENEFSFGSDDEEEESLSLDFDSLSFCKSSLSYAISRFQLEYTNECNSPKNCTPISGNSNQLPAQMSFKGIECSSHAKKHRIRALVEFSNNVDYYWNRNNQSFNTNNMLIGEGWWDENKNMLYVVFCHVIGGSKSTSLDGTHVGDCSLRLRLRFPSIWSIKNTSSIVGQIWSNKSASDPNYFKMITFRNDEIQNVVGGKDLKYEYSQLDRVKQSCLTNKVVKNQGKRYPDADSYDMRFDMSVRESKKKVAWGSSSPFFVDDQYLSSSSVSFSSESDAGMLNNNNGSLFNISYKISLYAMSSSPFDRNSLFNMSYYSVKISAEGIYDSGDGTLCMVGCRDLVSNNGTPIANSLDCEILMKFQFPSLDTNDRSYIKGSIESTRQKTDTLYFKRLEVSAVAYYIEEARRNVWRMDMEVVMALISTTLACVFIGLQLYHVKKHPNVLPYISLIMMSMLSFGHMIPLVLNFEALLAKNPNRSIFFMGTVEKWLEINETSVRLITMVAFLLQFRLLYLTWSSRKTDQSKNGLWTSQRKASYVTFPLYAAGLLIAFLLKLKKDRDSVTSTSVYRAYRQHDSSWENVKSYGGLVLDTFLVPQVILNLVSNMKENVLSCSFYFGTTFVRLLPHAYDLYRTSNYADQDRESYFYADPTQDFYSTAWDIFIPLIGIVIAIIIYLQQHFGAQCFLPQRFKGSKGYQKVAESEAEVETSNL